MTRGDFILFMLGAWMVGILTPDAFHLVQRRVSAWLEERRMVKAACRRMEGAWAEEDARSREADALIRSCGGVPPKVKV